MVISILCGGSGTRLWPISRASMPKQFAKLLGKDSLFTRTLERNAKLLKVRIILSCRKKKLKFKINMKI